MSGVALDLTDQTVIITGASSGIGRATAKLFAEAGARVIINHWQNLAGAEETQRLCVAANPAADTLLIEADMGAPSGPPTLFSGALAHFGTVDIVVNNSAIKRVQEPVAYAPDDFDAVLDVNLKGPFRLSQLAIKHFLALDQMGTVLCVSSIHDQETLISDIGYAMSKAALLMMVKSLAKAAAGGNIRVNAVSPGAIVTPMNKHWNDDKDDLARFAASVPMRRAGEAEDIASALLFLASDRAAYITGQTIYVDGGMTL